MQKAMLFGSLEVNLMLQDIVSLRRSWGDMLQDRWASDGALALRPHG